MSNKVSIKKLARDYSYSKIKLVRALDKLNNGEEECDCQIPEYVTIVKEHSLMLDAHYVEKRCVLCGGTIWEK